MTNSETKTVEQYVEAYLSEWLNGLDQSRKSRDQVLETLRDAVTLNNWTEVGNYVSYEGYHYLEQAAELLLNRMGSNVAYRETLRSNA
jgi:triphosphoribosyl-dephospho-CoA synthetase